MFKQRCARKVKVIAVTGFFALAGLSVAPAMAQDCDRACMTNMISL